ncbi:hypothetical protein [Pseudomonas syringae]|uniref:hypothetical protein n=1 Tax=Pseudomonas syringae TaxID=317 RepID=UPI003204AF64
MVEHKYFECRINSDEINPEMPDEWKEGFKKRVARLRESINAQIFESIDRELDRKRTDRLNQSRNPRPKPLGR